MMFAAVASQIVGILHNGTAWPMLCHVVRCIGRLDSRRRRSDDAISTELRMRFSDFVAYHALQENNRCLHLLSAHPPPLSDNAIHSLRIGVKRLRASWRLLRREVPEALFDGADARLRAIHRVLRAARDEQAVVGASRSLGGKTTKKRRRLR